MNSFKKISVVLSIGLMIGFNRLIAMQPEEKAPETPLRQQLVRETSYEGHQRALERSRQEARAAVEQARELLARTNAANRGALTGQQQQTARESLQQQAADLDRLRASNLSGSQGQLSNYARQLRARVTELNHPNSGRLVLPPAAVPVTNTVRGLMTNLAIIPVVGQAPLFQQPPQSSWHTNLYHNGHQGPNLRIIQPLWQNTYLIQPEEDSDVESEISSAPSLSSVHSVASSGSSASESFMRD